MSREASDRAAEEARYQRIRALDGAAPGAAAALAEALRDPSWRVRREAVAQAPRVADRAALVSALLGLLDDLDDVAARGAAADALGELGATALGELLTRLRAPEPYRRRIACEVLGRIGSPAAAHAVAALLGDPDANVRVAAAEALGQMPSPESQRALQHALGTEDFVLRLAALDGLWRLRAPPPMGALLSLLRDPLFRRDALRLLGLVREPAALEAIGPELTARDRRTFEAALAAIGGQLEGASSAWAAQVHEALAAAPDAAERALRAEAALHSDDSPVRRGAAAVTAAAEAAREHPRGGVEPPAPRAPPKPFAPGDDDEAFRALQRLVEEASGILLQPDLRFVVDRKLAPRIEATGAADLGAYVDRLAASRDELEQAIEALAPHETYFFRDAAQLEAFASGLLPELREQHAAERALRIWSAGCAAGEEAYTMAMLVAESGLFEGWDVRILGTDYARPLLAAARAGEYPRSALRDTDPARIERFFEPIGERFRVRDEVRALVSFARVNLVDAATARAVPPCDVALCRNVLIYFGPRARAAALRLLYEKLAPGGYLLLGHSENLLSMTTAFELAHVGGDLVYRRPAREPSR